MHHTREEAAQMHSWELTDTELSDVLGHRPAAELDTAAIAGPLDEYLAEWAERRGRRANIAVPRWRGIRQSTT
jgi:hypothetical protein